jgi:hypothetical protein
MYRICWRSRLTGYEGRGEPLARSVAESWIAALNESHPNIDHWLEPVS